MSHEIQLIEQFTSVLESQNATPIMKEEHCEPSLGIAKKKQPRATNFGEWEKDINEA